jgi:hypothetical protein
MRTLLSYVNGHSVEVSNQVALPKCLFWEPVELASLAVDLGMEEGEEVVVVVDTVAVVVVVTVAAAIAPASATEAVEVAVEARGTGGKNMPSCDSI